MELGQGHRQREESDRGRAQEEADQKDRQAVVQKVRNVAEVRYERLLEILGEPRAVGRGVGVPVGRTTVQDARKSDRRHGEPHEMRNTRLAIEPLYRAPRYYEKRELCAAAEDVQMVGAH